MQSSLAVHFDWTVLAARFVPSSLIRYGFSLLSRVESVSIAKVQSCDFTGSEVSEGGLSWCNSSLYG